MDNVLGKKILLFLWLQVYKQRCVPGRVGQLMSTKGRCFMADQVRKRGREQGWQSWNKLLVSPKPLVAAMGTSSHMCTAEGFVLSNEWPHFHCVPYAVS